MSWPHSLRHFWEWNAKDKEICPARSVPAYQKGCFSFSSNVEMHGRFLLHTVIWQKRSHHSYHLWLVRYIKYMNHHYPGLQSTVVFDGYHNQYKSTKYHKRIRRYRLRWSSDINLAIFNPQNIVDNIQLETHLIHNLILKLPFWHLLFYFLFSTTPRHQRATVSLTEMGRRGRCEAAGRAGIRGWPVNNNL